MAAELTVWEYADNEEASLKWTRDGSTVTVTDGGDNSYTYTIAEGQYFTGMTLVKDGSTVDWPENTAYTVKGTEEVTLSGTIVTATEYTCFCGIYVNKTIKGVTTVETLYEGFASSSVNSGCVFAYDSTENGGEIVFCYMNGTILYDEVYTPEAGIVTKVELSINDQPAENITTGCSVYGTIGSDYTSFECTIFVESVTSTFTLYHNNTD